MLPRKHKVTRSGFPGVLKTGKRFATPHTSITLLNGGSSSRLSFVVSKAVAPKAHDRNRLKRLGNKVAEEWVDLSGSGAFSAVCYFKKGALGVSSSFLEGELQQLFSQSGIVKRRK